MTEHTYKVAVDDVVTISKLKKATKKKWANNSAEDGPWFAFSCVGQLMHTTGVFTMCVS